MNNKKALVAFWLSAWILGSSCSSFAVELFRNELVTFVSADDTITLSGSLSLPNGVGDYRVPAAVLVSGAGPQDRDGTVSGVPLFKTLAEYLSSAGVAVLRYDDRGVGSSTSHPGVTYRDQTVNDFAKDAQGALAYLKQRREINPEKLFIIGHSEGGLVAAIAAAGREDLAGLVLLAATGIPIEQIQLEQRRAALQDDGLSGQEIEDKLKLSRDAFQVLKSTQDLKQARQQIMELMTSSGLSLERAKKYAELMSSKGFATLVRINPADFLGKIRVPTLAVSGSDDSQVLPESNLAAISSAVHSAGVTNVTIVTLTELNHLFQDSKAVASSLKTPPVASELPELVRDWIKAH